MGTFHVMSIYVYVCTHLADLTLVFLDVVLGSARLILLKQVIRSSVLSRNLIQAAVVRTLMKGFFFLSFFK